MVCFDRKNTKLNYDILKSINSKEKLPLQTPKESQIVLQYYPILRYTQILLDEVLCMQNVITCN